VPAIGHEVELPVGHVRGQLGPGRGRRRSVLVAADHYERLGPRVREVGQISPFMEGPDVADVQRLLGVDADGEFGPITAGARPQINS